MARAGTVAPAAVPATAPAVTARPAPARPAGNSGPSLAAQVTLTIPWETWHGTSDTPGDAGGFGLLDPGPPATSSPPQSGTVTPGGAAPSCPRRDRRRARLRPRPPPADPPTPAP